MRNLKLALCAAAAFIGTSAVAVPVTLTFEGSGDFFALGNFYNGGAGGDYGVTFSSDTVTLVANAAGGSGGFTNTPSGDTVLLFLTGLGDVMNVSSGFEGLFSFYYSAGQTGGVSIYSGLDGSGSLLSTLDLSVTGSEYDTWAAIGMRFAGTAHSVVFSGEGYYLAYDNITFDAAVPGAGSVPEPASWAMMLAGFGAIGGGLRSRRNGAISVVR